MASVYSLQSTDAACWHEAIKLYNSKLKDGPSSSKYISLGTRGNSENGPKNYAHELMGTAMDTYQKLTKRRGPSAIVLIQIINNLRQYARAVDVFIQCDPTIAGLGRRLMFQAGVEEEQASRIASEGILEIVRHAGRWEQVGGTADLHLSNFVAAYKGLGSLGEITADVHTVMHKIDKILEQIRHLSDNTLQLQLGTDLLTLTHETSLTSVILSGCGKSVMAGYLQEHLSAGDSKTLFYRFQRSASATQSTPTTFASSLIYQLLGKWPRPPLATGPYDQLQNLATQFPLGPQNCPFKMVWAVAASLLQVSESQFNLVIDAMDECLFGDSLSQGALAFLDNLFELIRKTRIKVVIFARPEPMFINAVRSGLSIFMTKDLLLPDIMTFAKGQYEQLGLPDSEMDAVLEFVRSSSHGSFRWAEMVLHHIGQSLQVKDLQIRMRTFPPSISELYKQLLLGAAGRFSKNKLECQKGLLLAIFQTQRPLRIAEIADAFSLPPDRAEIIISSLCKPLASTYGGFFHLSHPSVREFFELYDKENDGSLGISFSDSHGLLAEKCLSCLLNERYADPNRIKSYLVANHDEKAHVNPDARPLEDSFYDYAYRFWDYHLVRAKAPNNHLLQQANKFLLSLQFAYWSECSRQDCGQLVRVTVAFCSLTSWHKGLSIVDQSFIELEKYFERAYSLLSAAFESCKMDKVLPWLARMTIGLERLLGPRHHLTLRAKSDVAYVRFYSGKMRVSRRMYNEVIEIQREVLGEHSAHLLETLIYKGQSEYYMADFMAAAITWTKASAEFLALLGPDSWQYLSAQLWYARGVAYMGQLDIGLEILQSVAQKRCELFGPGDSFFNAVQVNVGEIQLLLGRYEESITTLQDVLKWRRESFLISNMFRLDAEITLAIAYQAAGMSKEALTIINEIEEGAGDLRSEFERYCQVVHLKGLLLAEAGSLNEAINLLQNTVIQAEEDQNNRALLWVRLDLATMLRNRDAECDRAEASINFDKIVKDISGDYAGFPDEPDPPRLLAAAEKALRLVRSRKHAEARHQLESEHLDWRRTSDFWLWVGGSFNKDLLQLAEPALVRTV
ncbi:hypothetical protein GQX73_g6100 [Xylaria multiplex]|uniref:Nephrocystin 3-like N-terminal domain-containing protein n=1 Tax=Xylaria multiplex TaxID=323545 RepID=A0A7C8MKX2_9PEZI|nr:hypothetical protein GQX73_g6100 [Xylaria multiplex]